MKIVKTFLIILSVSGFCFGQVVEDENWIKEIAGEYCSGYRYLTYQYKTFSKENVAKAKEKLKLIKQSVPKNEWEGIYTNRGVAIGDDGLVWNSRGGFLSFYCYHELTSLDYGSIKESPDSVELVSEKSVISTANKKQIAKTENKLVKVKFGERHFLVPENLLKYFTAKAAGLSTNMDESYSNYYLDKVEDIEKAIFGLPILPAEYKHFLRYPIKAKIISAGSKKIIPNEQSTKEFNFDDIHYPVTLNAGKNKNIKIKMNFFVEDLGEWIEITKVFQTKSIGFIRRDFDENGWEQCRDSEGGSGQLIPCKEIKVGMMSKTKVSNL